MGTLILDFQPPELGEHQLLLFLAIKFVVTCYDSPRKLIRLWRCRGGGKGWEGEGGEGKGGRHGGGEGRKRSENQAPSGGAGSRGRETVLPPSAPPQCPCPSMSWVT